MWQIGYNICLDIGYKLWFIIEIIYKLDQNRL